MTLLGYRKFENSDIPKGYNLTTIDDVYPVEIFNEKTIPDNKIGKYINDEFNYYLNIYKNINQFGLPYKNFLDAPLWVLSLYHLFKDIENEYEIYRMSHYK